MERLPASGEDKLAYLSAAAKHGEAINRILKVGARVAELRAYAAANDLSLIEADGESIILHYGDLVNWRITVDQEDIILGYTFSGYRDLMEKLGVNFAGMPYEAG